MTSNRLGNTAKDKNTRLVAVLKGVEGLRFGNFEENQIDTSLVMPMSCVLKLMRLWRRLRDE